MRKKLKFDNPDTSDDDESLIQPIYEYPPAKYNAEEIFRILLKADKSKVCEAKQSSIRKSATYVVDVRNLRNRDDNKKDEFGIWHYSGSHPQPYKVHQNEDGSLFIEKCCPGATGANVVLLRRLHCTHPSNAKFKRLICFLTGIYIRASSA